MSSKGLIYGFELGLIIWMFLIMGLISFGFGYHQGQDITVIQTEAEIIEPIEVPTCTPQSI